MNDKEYVLRKALEKDGFDNVPVKSLVVFTNDEIEIKNENEFIKTCTLSELPHLIEQMAQEVVPNQKFCIQGMLDAIENSRATFTYNYEKRLEKAYEHYEEVVALLATKPERRSFLDFLRDLFRIKKKPATI
jgi:hypothetical protein